MRKSLEASTRLYHDELKKNPEVVAYLTEERGLSWEAISHFSLGYTGEHPAVGDPKRRISFPYDTFSGIVQMRFRTLEPDPEGWKYLGSEGLSTRLYNTNSLLPPHPTVYLTEGELDTITLWCCGLPSVGVPGGHAWKKEYWRVFRHRRVVVLGDGDETGKKFCGEVVADLNRSMIESIAVEFPEKMDVNSLYCKGGEEAVKELVGL